MYIVDNGASLHVMEVNFLYFAAKSRLEIQTAFGHHPFHQRAKGLHPRVGGRVFFSIVPWTTVR